MVFGKKRGRNDDEGGGTLGNRLQPLSPEDVSPKILKAFTIRLSSIS